MLSENSLTMVAKKVLMIGFFLCLLGTTTIATTRSTRLSSTKLCNLQRLTATKPVQRSEFEGGFMEVWNPNDDQYKCIGAFPSKITIEPGCLKPPAYHHWPLLVFIEQGEGVMGMSFPGCAETHNAGVQEQQVDDDSKDSHQKVFRVKKGDIIAIPAGAMHWSYNDGNQESVSVIINDLNNPSNQLDTQSRTFHLSGGTFFQRDQTSRGRGQRQKGVHNLYAGFNTELLAEALECDKQTVRAVQESGELGRGLVIRVPKPMRFDTFDEQQVEQPGFGSSEGFEEDICGSKTFSLDNPEKADIFSRVAGKLNIVNEHKFPVLSYMELSAERGQLEKVQIVSNNGVAMFDAKVSKGDAFVIPQFFVSTAQAGENGFEWVAFKTNKAQLKSQIMGHGSVFRAVPLDVITNAYYGMSPEQARNLKTKRATESTLFSPHIEK